MDRELQRCVSLLATAPSTQGVGAIEAEMADNASNRHGRQDFGDQGGRKEGTFKKKISILARERESAASDEQHN